MHNLSRLYPILIMIFGLFIGCSNPVKEEVLSENTVKMVEILKDVEKDDCLTLYHLFSGMSEYVSRYEGITKNSQAFSLFKVVKERYGKSDGFLDKEGSENDPNDLIESQLKEMGMEAPQDLTEESRGKLVLVFKEFADGSLKAYRSKK